MSPVVTRQGASAFNQPLSLDTSSVTKMGGMFRVRPPRLPCPVSGRTLRARCVHRSAPHALAPLSPGIAPPVSPVVSRQGTAFNQPLSFDTSSVTDMSQMFYVRHPRVPLPPCPV